MPDQTLVQAGLDIVAPARGMIVGCNYEEVVYIRLHV